MRRFDERAVAGSPTGVAATLAAVSLNLLMVACGSSTPSSESTPPQPAASQPARVFFVQPQDGAMVKSPVHFEFGTDQFTIAAVPAGTVDAPRPAVGHYHLGVDQDCMPAGQVIPPGTPAWVHFGKGNNTIDMQLTPGTHKFAVQVGDDQHRTIEGLCQAISITVTE